jgi:hypothetical protein
MKVEWIEYKGKKILYVEYSGAKDDDELIGVLHREVEIEKTLTEKTLCLVTVANAHAGTRYMDELKKLGKEVRNEKVAKTATLGVEGIQRVLFNAYILFTGEVNKTFSSEEEAKEWLIK